MSKNVYLKDWRINNTEATVELIYSDETIINVRKKDFDRAFGAMVNASKADIIREFAI